jgi:hypothetical protein
MLTLAVREASEPEICLGAPSLARSLKASWSGGLVKRRNATGDSSHISGQGWRWFYSSWRGCTRSANARRLEFSDPSSPQGRVRWHSGLVGSSSSCSPRPSPLQARLHRQPGTYQVSRGTAVSPSTPGTFTAATFQPGRLGQPG